MPEVLTVQDVGRTFAVAGGAREALRGVSFTVAHGETVGVIGESGAGKSTLGRIVAGLDEPTSGRVLVAGASPRVRPGRTSPVQIVFQNPTDALNPFLPVGESVAEPLRGRPRRERRARVSALLESVGLDPARARQQPRAFSGGQLQRVVIARALAAEPKLLVCDEPTSALDVSVQAQIVNMLLRLQAELGFACVLITHDLAVARVLADEIVVLRGGAVVEQAPADAFFAGPRDDYSVALLRAVSIEGRASARALDDARSTR